MFAALSWELLQWREWVFGSTFAFFFAMMVVLCAIWLRGHAREQRLLRTAAMKLDRDAVYPGESLPVSFRLMVERPTSALAAAVFLVSERSTVKGPLVVTKGGAHTTVYQVFPATAAGELLLQAELPIPDAAQHSLSISDEEIAWSVGAVVKFSMTTWRMRGRLSFRVLPVQRLPAIPNEQ
jgi:hypothetical protein